MKMLGKMGLRDQNNGKRIGINGSWIYHVTTLLYQSKLFTHSLGVCNCYVSPPGILGEGAVPSIFQMFMVFFSSFLSFFCEMGYHKF